MSQLVEVDGVEYEVPDDATPEEIGKIAKPTAEPPAAAPSETLGSKALGIAKDVLAAPVGLLDAGLSVASQAAAYPLSIAAGAGEQISPWGNRSEAREPPLGPGATPEEIAARDRRESLYQHRDNLSRGNAERKAVSDALTYTPKTASGRKALEDLSWLLDKTLGRVGRAGGNVAASIAKAAGAEPPEQEEARATAAEATNNIVGAAMPAALSKGSQALRGLKTPLAELAERAAVRSAGADRAATKRVFGRPISEAARQETGRFLLDEKVPLRSPGAMSEGLADIIATEGPEIGATVDAASKAGARINVNSVAQKVLQDPEIARLANNTKTRPIYEDVKSFLDDQIANHGGHMDPVAAHELRRSLDNLAKWERSPNMVDSTSAGAYRRVRNMLNDEIDAAMKSAGLEAQWNKANAAYRNASRAKDMADVGVERRVGNRLGSPSEKLAAVVGAGAAMADPVTGMLIPAGTVALNRGFWPATAHGAEGLSRLIDALPATSGSTASSIAKGAALADLLRRLSLPPENGPGPRWPLGVAPAAADDTSRR